jgi:hypothetical protein
MKKESKMTHDYKHLKNITKIVDCGDRAIMMIIDPDSFKDGGVEWIMRYANTERLLDVRYIVASLLGSYDYLLSDCITQKEAMRRLKLMRKARNTKSTKGD